MTAPSSRYKKIAARGMVVDQEISIRSAGR
jgi:hypothetical protein